MASGDVFSCLSHIRSKIPHTNVLYDQHFHPLWSTESLRPPTPSFQQLMPRMVRSSLHEKKEEFRSQRHMWVFTYRRHSSLAFKSSPNSIIDPLGLPPIGANAFVGVLS